MDNKKELHEIINLVESAKYHLSEVTEAMDSDYSDVDSLNEALDAQVDAIDIITVHLTRKNKYSSRVKI